jgi:DNA (cytosine-5)-methyltransferase 1
LGRVYSINGIGSTLNANGGGCSAKTGLYFIGDGVNSCLFKIRRLTPKECFRLMGVKDEDIEIVVSDSQAYKIAGNGIEVNTMRSILRSLYKPVKNKGSLF